MTMPVTRIETARPEVRRLPKVQLDDADRRLVVLVPSLEIDASRLARRIWEMAAPSGLGVLYLALCPNLDHELRLRRHLVTLAAVTRDLRVPVEVEIEFGRSWTRAVRRVWRVGDRVVCHAEQRSGLRDRPLAETLQAALAGPVQVITGFHTAEAGTGKRSRTFARWVTPVVVVVGVFFFQVFLPRLSAETTRQALVYLSLSAGLGLIWVWTRSLF